MLPGGDWRPTSESFSDKVRSYQISSLYSPADMFDWEEMALDYLQAQETGPDGMRSFVNTRLGLPYRETGARPDWQNVIELRGNYRAGTVPQGVIFLTLAVDVQRGSEKKEKNNPARLEVEVCGHGMGYRSWSIEHIVFEGEIDDPNSGAWAKLAEYWQETGMAYKRNDGARFVVQKGLVDSGDGPHTPCVYAFTAGWNGIYPSKGMPSVKRRKGEPLDEDMNRSIRRFRIATIDSGKTLVEINGPFYKRQIYTNLKIPRKVEDSQQANFCDFPIDYGQKYFEQLTAEEMVFDREGTVTFHKSSARPNEALDLRVMNLCARDAFLEDLVMALRADAKARGHLPPAVAAINSRIALEWLAAAVTAKQKN
jgi:phage terminase large subunit GpA-like protein